MWPSLGVRSPPWIYGFENIFPSMECFATHPFHVENWDQFLHLLRGEQLCRALLVTLGNIIKLLHLKFGDFPVYLSGKILPVWKEHI